MPISPHTGAVHILFDGDGLVAIDKPSGLPSTGRDLRDPQCAQFRLSQQLGRPVWAVHQLDASTSGVLLFVRRKSLVAEWQKALARGQKRYLALCEGTPSWPARRLRAPLRYVKRQQRVMVTEDGKAADSHFQVLVRAPGAAWIRASPKTGRTHQIRAHMAYLGHPLVGDELHGGQPFGQGNGGAMLHCAEIHAGALQLAAPLPARMRQAAVDLGLPPDPTAT